MKDTVTETKTNLQGVNSRVEVENQISDLRKQKPPNQSSKKKKEENTWGQGKEPRGQLQPSHHGGAGRKREQESENLLEKTTENLSKLEIDIQVQEAQSPKQDEHKEAQHQDTS